jgi:uroporphyrinogen decarboxylase
LEKRERLQAALRGEPVDRTPFSLWRHFHCEDRTALGLADATLELARALDLDLVKLTPCGLYAIEDWCQDGIEFPGTEHEAPVLLDPALKTPGAWATLPILDPDRGALARELEVVRTVTRELGADTPMVMTIFSPLTLALKLVGERVVGDLRNHPSELHAGLTTIAAVTRTFAQRCLEAGASGFFFATQLASHLWLSREEYAEFGEPYDLAVLEAIADQSEITALHLHGQQVFFDLANRYPVDAVSWHNWETAPDLFTARELTNRAFLTGLDRRLLETGPAEAIAEQARKVIAQTKARGLVLAPCCVIPTYAPSEHLSAVRQAVFAS